MFLLALLGGPTFLPWWEKHAPGSQSPFGLGPRTRHMGKTSTWPTGWRRVALDDSQSCLCQRADPWARDKGWLLNASEIFILVACYAAEADEYKYKKKKKKKKKYYLRLWKQLDSKNSKTSFLQEHHVWRTYPASKVNHDGRGKTCKDM